jgi:2-hydroxychromene-2-carboxylate isomerase
MAEAAADRPVFYFDYSSPYAYLAAERVHSVLPEPPEWQPISFGFVLRESGRVPWSFKPDRANDMREIERRAAERSLPEIRWPRGWSEGETPADSYSLAAARAGIFAKGVGRVVAFSLAAFRQAFAAGRDLSDPDTILLAAAACELHPNAVLKGIESQSVKDGLKQATEEAIARGVGGIPTIAVGGELFWGDDELEQAAAAISERR